MSYEIYDPKPPTPQPKDEQGQDDGKPEEQKQEK